MKRVSGIGGIFFKANDPKSLADRYRRHPGIDMQSCSGAAFIWADNNYCAPSKPTFMINYRVANLVALLKALRDEECRVLEKTDDSEYVKFGWVTDPEGNKIELWEPPSGQ